MEKNSRKIGHPNIIHVVHQHVLHFSVASKKNARMKTALKNYFPLASAGNGGLVTDKKIDQNIHEVDNQKWQTSFCRPVSSCRSIQQETSYPLFISQHTHTHHVAATCFFALADVRSPPGPYESLMQRSWPDVLWMFAKNTLPKTSIAHHSPWKLMVGRRSFPFGFRTICRGESLLVHIFRWNLGVEIPCEEEDSKNSKPPTLASNQSFVEINRRVISNPPKTYHPKESIENRWRCLDCLTKFSTTILRSKLSRTRFWARHIFNSVSMSAMTLSSPAVSGQLVPS